MLRGSKAMPTLPTIGDFTITILLFPLIQNQGAIPSTWTLSLRAYGTIRGFACLATEITITLTVYIRSRGGKNEGSENFWCCFGVGNCLHAVAWDECLFGADSYHSGCSAIPEGCCGLGCGNL